MANLDQTQINHAVHRCLARCYASTEVLATLAAFLEELRQNNGRSEREIHEVELAVLKVLHRIVEDSDCAPDAGAPSANAGCHTADLRGDQPPRAAASKLTDCSSMPCRIGSFRIRGLP
jgi:hypothetical protein